MEFRAGQFLVSNLLKEKGAFIFEETVAKIADREKQWEKIKKVGADQRLCRLFSNKKQFKKWLAGIFNKM